MQWRPIQKPSATWAIPPNLLDYDTTCATVSWEAVHRELDGLPGGTGLNMAHEAVDRHANDPQRDHLVLRWLGRDGTTSAFTYGDVQEHSNRFANVLRQLGVTKGERVFALVGRIPALYLARRHRALPRGPCPRSRWEDASPRSRHTHRRDGIKIALQQTYLLR